MINFDEELKKYKPSLEVDQAEEAIARNDLRDVIDIENMTIYETYRDGYLGYFVASYDKDKNFIESGMLCYVGDPNGHLKQVFKDGNLVQFTVTSSILGDNVAFIRMSAEEITDKSVVNINGEIINTPAWDKQFNQLSAEKANKSGLTLGVHTDGLVYLFIDGVPHGNGLELKADVIEGDVYGYVDENNTVVLNGNLADGTYTLKYEMENGNVIDIGNLVLDNNVYYSITKNLTNCIISNTTSEVAQGNSYSATITANNGYELKSVTVTMGGNPVSVSGGVITIEAVTGDIVITAVAEEKAVTPSYTNLLPKAINADGTPYNGGKGYKSGYKMSTSSGNESATTDAYCSGFMPISDIYDEIYVKNVTLSNTANVNNFVFYDANKTKIGVGTANGTAGAFNVNVTDKGNGVYQCSPQSWLTTSMSVAFFRFSCGGITDETIVTVNEEIV